MNDFRKNKSVHSPAEVARNSIKRTPAEVAREAFKQMATQSIMPTPDHYQTIYNQIAGIREKETLNNALTQALKKLPHDTVECWRAFKNDHLCALNFDQAFNRCRLLHHCG